MGSRCSVTVSTPSRRKTLCVFAVASFPTEPERGFDPPHCHSDRSRSACDGGVEEPAFPPQRRIRGQIFEWASALQKARHLTLNS